MISAGIGLPSYIPGASGETVLKWAAAADERPFSSLSLIDRVVYPNCDPLISLAAAAALTKRVRLITTVLLAALWEPVRLAKQAASIDVLSGGRLTLGVSSGGSLADFAATGYRYTRRGKRLEEILDILRKVWRGEPVPPEAPPVGPMPVQPGGPPLLIGAIADVAIARVGKYADGFIASGIGPQLEMAKVFAGKVLESWRAANRSGSPILKKAVYFALGPSGLERGAVFIRDYYGPLDHLNIGITSETFVQGVVTTEEGIRAVLKAYEEAGYDEVCFWPTIAELDQMDRLAGIVG